MRALGHMLERQVIAHNLDKSLPHPTLGLVSDPTHVEIAISLFTEITHLLVNTSDFETKFYASRSLCHICQWLDDQGRANHTNSSIVLSHPRFKSSWLSLIKHLFSDPAIDGEILLAGLEILNFLYRYLGAVEFLSLLYLYLHQGCGEGVHVKDTGNQRKLFPFLTQIAQTWLGSLNRPNQNKTVPRLDDYIFAPSGEKDKSWLRYGPPLNAMKMRLGINIHTYIHTYMHTYLIL